MGEEERCGDGHDGRRQKSEGIHFSLEISKRIKNFNVRESLELEISIKKLLLLKHNVCFILFSTRFTKDFL